MPRPFSTRRFTFIYAFAAALLTALAGTLFRFHRDQWIVATLLFGFLLAALLLYQRLLRRHIRKPVDSSGLSGILPPPSPGAARDPFDVLFDLLQDGMLILDAENRIGRANTTAAKLLGEPPDSLIGRHLADLADHEDLERLAARIRATGIYQAAEIHLHVGPALCNAAGIPIPDEGETGCSHILLVLRDISRLRQLERAGEEYATNVSHELKTPLTLILGYAETLLAHGEIDAEFRAQSLRTVERHAKRILRIIDDLLRLAWLKNENHTVGIPRAPATVASVIAEAVAIGHEWTRPAGIEVETHVPGGLVWNLNAGLIEEALVNLLKNAVLYALVGPVQIRARVLDGGNLELAVIDRGPGLKPEDAKRIFDRFYRADKGRARASGGSGLGLPIVQQIVEAHHGTARVETAPGEGCTFILEIPPA